MSELMERVLACSPEEKAELFRALGSEYLARPGAQAFPIVDASNRTIGYLAPELGMMIPMDEAHRAEVRRRIKNPGRQLSVEEFLKEAELAAKSKLQPTT